MKTVFLRALKADDKETALRAAIREPEAARGQQRFEVDPARFVAVPSSPFAYWVSDAVLRLFADLPSFKSTGGTARQGLATANDDRFARAWWEVSAATLGTHWFPLSKGGIFSPFYSDIHLVVNWGRNGWEIINFSKPPATQIASRVQNTSFYFRPGLTWPLRTHRFCPQIMPAGVVISVRGSGIFSTDPELSLAIFSSLVPDRLLKMLSGKDAHPQFDMGDISELPVPQVPPAEAVALRSYARRAWSLKRTLDTCSEISHAFTLPALLQVDGDTLAVLADAWAEHVAAVKAELADIQAEIDERCFDLYGIDEVDRRAITEGFDGAAGQTQQVDEQSDAGIDEETDAEGGGDARTLAAELISWAVGVAFGRFDVLLATGARPLPPEPEPFDPLPVCSPAMLTGEDGLPLASAPAAYPLAFPENGILVDDPGDPRDLTGAVHAVFDEVFGESADAIWEEAAALLDPKSQNQRSWLASGVFEHHLKRYSKSRRKAPILWQLAVPSGRYSVWLYAHRLTGDSFFQIQNDVVAPKLAHEERRLTSLVQSTDGNPSAKERKEIDAQETFVQELRALLEEIKRVAPIWSPTLDDGVVLTMAPLWPLVAQHKPWQRELKSKWDELAAGKYDWAHIAMQLWPERVVPKCAADRSLAIAHGLEDTFWVEGDDGKWEARSDPVRPVEELVGERSSASVKAALESALDRPGITVVGTRRARAA